MFNELREAISAGQVAVMPTDTIYGLVASALDVDAVERVYELKERSSTKPCIVLISDVEQLKKFGVDPWQWRPALDQHWPGPVSIALPQQSPRWNYLSRGSGFITFRLPEPEAIVRLLQASGPVIAPSANPEGLPPAQTIEEAQEYFGDAVGVYVDHHRLADKPSKIIRLESNGSVTVIRD